MLYEVWFSGQENELVTDLNKPYTQQKWSLINDDVTLLIIDDQSIPVRVITSPSGQKVRYALWFEVDERIFTNKVQAKLYQTWLVLWGMHPSGKLIILGVDSTSSFTDALDVVNP